MKKMLLFSVLFISIGSIIFAAPFTPTVLKLSAPPAIHSDFDGTTLDIPVTVKGTPAALYFLVFTKGQAATIGPVRNGYLGWHYVNKIDTCLYLSDLSQTDVGSTTIKWDGNDDDGNAVPSGVYTYYIFGYDNASMRTQMTKQLTIHAHGAPNIVTHDDDGNPLVQPILVNSLASGNKTAEATVSISNKWVIGGDPEDASLVETTSWMGWGHIGGSRVAFEPGSNMQMYFTGSLKEAFNARIMKWEWVPNGESVLQEDWGEDGYFLYTVAEPAGWSHSSGAVSDGKGYLFTQNSNVDGNGTESELIYIDVEDGSEIKRLDMADYWVSVADGDAGGQTDSGPISLRFKHDLLIMGAHTTCMNTLVDPYYEDEEDAHLWANSNGDYTGDHNWEPDAARAWVCNDYMVGPYKYNPAGDDNLFVAFSSFDIGAVSFGLYAPDGTGMDYQVLSGETAAQKYGIEIIDYGSAYDGIYTTNNSSGSVDATYWHVGHDSIKGVITSEVAVEETPSEFAVNQNSPNPFNPSTTISFSTVETGNVTIDVFNVAGQKIDTISNEFMNSGSHSVVWDASGFSAGVYFYTVKSGDITKTMKMTLLK